REVRDGLRRGAELGLHELHGSAVRQGGNGVRRRLVPLVVPLVVLGTACSGGAPSAPDDTPVSVGQVYDALDPGSCRPCHADHVRAWSGSMHAYASDDPVFRAMNARGQRETGGALGAFCVACHAPVAAARKATTDGANLSALPQKIRGVTCVACHAASA